MTTREQLLSTAAKALSEASELPASTPSREVRARAIGAMEAALRARAAKRRRRVWIGRFAVAAAILLGSFGGYRYYSILHARNAPTAPALAARASIGATGHGAATAMHAGHAVPFDGASLASGDRVTTSAAPAAIALSTGTTVDLEPSADVTFVATDGVQSFELAGGGLLAHVAKLHDGERFVVHTRDVEVEVRGTVFEVAVVPADASCAASPTTRVRVQEGVVVVRTATGETRVAAGDQWPSGCLVSPPPPPLATITAVPSTTPSTPAPEPKPSPATSASSSVAPADALAAKNDLFAAALAAERKGELATALSKYEAYLAEYPGGELAESASAERMRIYARIDPPRAVAEAREYLARWPDGFAHDEAASIVGPESPSPSTSASNEP